MEQKNQYIKECGICKISATCLCFKCANFFCESCDNFIHDKKININHIKENIDPFIPIDIRCPEHPEYPMHLFCINEKGN